MTGVAALPIGEDCIIEDFAVVGPDVTLAPGVRIGSHCSVSHCRIGERSRLWPGSRLGQDGFGFIPGAAEGGAASKVPQMRGISIGSDVEIGAGCTVDRGSRRDTTISGGCKLDNQVHIGHNVELGAHCLIAAQTGIAGSVTVGRGVLIGGQVGLAQHLTVGDGARIAARSAVMRDVEAGTTVGGSPAVPMSEYRRQSMLLSRLARSSGVVRRLLALVGA